MNVENYKIEFVSDFEIEDLGICEEWVYDIEVEECHNFFGNDILVHNSAMVDVQPFIDQVKPKDEYKFVQKMFKEVIVPIANRTTKRFHEMSNSLDERMLMKQEKIYSATFATAKKRYAYDVVENEGVKYAEPKITITGIEVVKSSTPTWCRDKLKECVRIILREDEKALQNYIKEIKKEWFSGHIPLDDIARVSTVNDAEKYDAGGGHFKERTPGHVKAALNLNNQSEKNNLLYHVDSGNKIAYLHLKMPNPTGIGVIAFVDDSMDKLDLMPYLDLKEQWEKSFIKPLSILTDSVKWTIEKKNKLGFL